ncbi:MAG: molecular chaperone DnaK (HSP70) [Psychroserpens sp.]|jgi:molecular chaperone DnaK (HSP70)
MMIYDCLVSGIEDEIVGKEGICTYLASLKPVVRMLRGAYRKYPALVPYEKETVQSAYLITYLPHYYQLIEKILREQNPDSLSKKASVNITFVGGGPGSEVYGAIKHILFHNKVIKSININILDINANTWGYSHKIVKDSLIQNIIGDRDVSITWNSFYLDLVDHSSVKARKEIIRYSELVVVQNCINEINPTQYSELSKSIISIFENIPSQGALLMIDLTSSVRSSIKSLQDDIKNLSDFEEVVGTLDNSSPTSMVSINSRPNEIIRNHLLNGTDGLIPRKNLKYDYSLISKCVMRVAKDQSEVGLNILYSPLSRSGLGELDEVRKRTFIGLDFGTSVSVCTMAYLQDDQLKLRTLGFEQKGHHGEINTSPLIPSVMAVYKNKFMLGKYASQMKPLLEKDKNVWHGFKTNLGKLGSIQYPYSILGNHPDRKISNAKEGLEVYLTLIFEQILKFVDDNNLPNDIYCSASVPANFEEFKKSELRECLSEAGFKLEETPFTQEPVSALICALHNGEVSFKQRSQKSIMVLDLGAGTVDVSIINLSFDSENVNSEILSVQRISEIGGDKINELIYDELNLKYNFDLSDKDKILCACESLKIIMCKAFEVGLDLKLPIDATSASKKRDVSCNIDSIGTLTMRFDVLFGLMKMYWATVETTLITACNQAGLLVSTLDDVILSGGGARNPYIRAFANDYFSNSNIIIPDNIQEQVARGNALQCFVQNVFGKNMINSKLAQSIFIRTIKGEKILFEVGVITPTLDVELNGSCVIGDKITIRYEQEEGLVQFLVTGNLTNAFFYLTSDQEIKCEAVINNNLVSLIKTYIN